MVILPREEFGRLCIHYQFNLYKTCFMCSSGTLRVFGTKESRYHKNNVADGRFLFTVLRVVVASGVNGPVLLLARFNGIHKMFFGFFVR